MVEDSFKTFDRIARNATKNKINICFNPNNYLCEKGKDLLKTTLAGSGRLVLNSEEEQFLNDVDSDKDKLLMLKALKPKKLL